MEARAHIIVTGMVQGVGFRYFAYQRAKDLGIKGKVKNLMNGNVEIHAEGDRSLIQEFISQVQVGPRSARVTDVRVEWKPVTHEFSEFNIS